MQHWHAVEELPNLRSRNLAVSKCSPRLVFGWIRLEIVSGLLTLCVSMCVVYHCDGVLLTMLNEAALSPVLPPFYWHD